MLYCRLEKYVETVANALIVEKYIKMTQSPGKTYHFMKAVKMIIQSFSKIVFTLEHSTLVIQIDPFYNDTFGSNVFGVYDRYTISDTYLNTCEMLGEYNHLMAFHKKWESKIKSDPSTQGDKE